MSDTNKNTTSHEHYETLNVSDKCCKKRIAVHSHKLESVRKEARIDDYKARGIVLGILACSHFHQYALLCQEIANLNTDIATIISPKLGGVDKLVERYGREKNIPVRVVASDYCRYGQAATEIRNDEIVNASEQVIVFWDGKAQALYNAVKTMRRDKRAIKVVLWQPKI